MKTKQKILYVTLELMAINGFEGVSVRDIAAGVGVKESSLYKHYSSKSAIFDSLMDEMDNQFCLAMDGLNFATAGSTGMGIGKRTAKERMEELDMLCSGLFFYLLNDKYAGAFRRVLTTEQFRNDKAAKMYQSHFFDLPLSLFSGVFRTMLEYGEIPYADADFLALEFYAPVYMLLCRCYSNQRLTDLAAQVLKSHVAAFGKQYCRA